MNLKKVLGIAGIVTGLTVASGIAVGYASIKSPETCLFDRAICFRDSDLDGFSDAIETQSKNIRYDASGQPLEEFLGSGNLRLRILDSGLEGHFSASRTISDWNPATNDWKKPKYKGGINNE